MSLISSARLRLTFCDIVKPSSSNDDTANGWYASNAIDDVRSSFHEGHTDISSRVSHAHDKDSLAGKCIGKRDSVGLVNGCLESSEVEP